MRPLLRKKKSYGTAKQTHSRSGKRIKDLQNPRRVQVGRDPGGLSWVSLDLPQFSTMS